MLGVLAASSLGCGLLLLIVGREHIMAVLRELADDLLTRPCDQYPAECGDVRRLPR